MVLDYTARDDRLEGLQPQHTDLRVRAREAAPAKEQLLPHILPVSSHSSVSSRVLMSLWRPCEVSLPHDPHLPGGSWARGEVPGCSSYFPASRAKKPRPQLPEREDGYGI